jgi:hypothetical protein
VITDLVDQLATGKPAEAEKAFAGLWRETLPALQEALRKHAGSVAKQFEPPLRLFDHIIDIAACRFARGEEVAADRLLKTVGSVLDVLRNGAPAGGLLGAHGKCPREVMSQIHDTRLRCAFRLMEVNLGTISPWPKEAGKAAPGSGDAARLEEAIGEFNEGQRILQEYAGWQDRRYDNYVCFLNTHRARAAYLGREYALAYLFLDAARAAVRRPSRGSDFSTLAVIVLHQAECLMLHADDELTRAPADPTVLASARTKLDRARTALGQVHTFLERGRPQVWAWAWLRVLEAQLAHESILWAFDGGADDPIGRDDEPFRRGLTAVRLGLDCSGPCRRRQMELDILWWQLFLCHKVRLGRAGMYQEHLEAWRVLNVETGLGAYYGGREDLLEQFKGPPPRKPTRQIVLRLEVRLLRGDGMPLSGRPGRAPKTPAAGKGKRARR